MGLCCSQPDFNEITHCCYCPLCDLCLGFYCSSCLSCSESQDVCNVANDSEKVKLSYIALRQIAKEAGVIMPVWHGRKIMEFIASEQGMLYYNYSDRIPCIEAIGYQDTKHDYMPVWDIIKKEAILNNNEDRDKKNPIL